MFTDMVGFTALMQENEVLAMKRRNKHRKVLKEVTSHFNGNIIQYFGDGTLSIFDSAKDAVECGIEIQKQLMTAPEVPLRIGIHTGDITYDEEGIYGNGVNVASRIESFALPGSVLVSGYLYKELKNHPDIEMNSLGTYELKNVIEPMEIFAVVSEHLYQPDPEEVKGKGKKAVNSIAVLPFVNMSGDPENEFFSDGITEEILNVLTRIEGLRVTSRTSSFAFKGKNGDIREVASKLNVKTILEGSVRKAGNRVRITAQLINASDDYHFWSETYDRHLDDIFAVQDEIALKIANKLRAYFGEETAAIEHGSTKNMEAYELFLRGRFHWSKFTPGDVKKAIHFYTKSHEIDPNYISPLSGIVYAYAYLGALGQVDSKVAFKLSKDFVSKALVLDDDYYQTHISLGLIEMFWEWDFFKAEYHLKKALKQNPNSADGHYVYAMLLSAMEKIDDAIIHIGQSVKLDPLNILSLTYEAQCYARAGKIEISQQKLDHILKIDPMYRPAMEVQGWAHFINGDLESAKNTFERLKAMFDDPLKGAAPIGFIYAKMGETEKAQEMLSLLEQREKRDEQVALEIDFAIIHSGLGNVDKVMEYLERAYRKKLGTLIFMLSFPGWRYLKTNPKFVDLKNRVGVKTT